MRNAPIVKVNKFRYTCHRFESSKIGDCCIVAAGSVVTNKIPRNCLAAEIPAKVIKENVQWR